MKIIISLVLLLSLVVSFNANATYYCLRDSDNNLLVQSSYCPSGYRSIPKSVYDNYKSSIDSKKNKNSAFLKIIDAGVGGFFGGGGVFIVLSGIFFIAIFIYNLIRKKKYPEEKKSIKSKLANAANSSINKMTGGISEDDVKEIYYKKLKESASKITPEEEENIYSKVSQEFKSKEIKEGLWTKALIQCEGDENKAKILYMKLRAEQITIETIEKKEK